ncbi:hypothetical protein E2C01_087923 [Portunus trituberculatus]|uniref:Uncharacterized protein n=1 Tax=Portunus trituberculatus TaxID=210409 RepID=A0A5B7JKM0_PORTR|nr:hypothetical protein [Portunus trituberculatus]
MIRRLLHDGALFSADWARILDLPLRNNKDDKEYNSF